MTVVLLRPDKPGIYNQSDLYDPNNPNGTGQIVPALNSFVLNQGQLFSVSAVDPTTLASTLVPVFTQTEPQAASVISYGNDVFSLYYDTRTTPCQATVEARCVIMGSDPSYYQIVRYPGASNETVISQNYGVSGNYISQNVPMQAVTNVDNTWFFPSTPINTTLTNNEEIRLDVYSAEGNRIATVTTHAVQSAVVNAATSTYQPAITALNLLATQQTGPNAFYAYPQQNVASLFLNAQLVYDDGTTVTVPIDQKQCFLYGTEDFIASYPGLSQQLLVKYYLSPGEVAANATNMANGFIATEATITVVAPTVEGGGKISIIPLWNSALSAYILRYFYYTTDRTAARDITAQTTISAGSFSGSLYGVAQSITLRVDFNQVDPVTWPTSTVYTQNAVITLQPIAALVRYIIRDSVSSINVYGQDSSAARRPILMYDSTLNQFFIPSAIFGDVSAVINSFYTLASPPYDINVETIAPTPTHFLLRDPTSGAMLVPQIIPLTEYATAFNVIATPGAYVKSTLIVEFIQQVSGNNLTLYGVPVDVFAGSYA